MQKYKVQKSAVVQYNEPTWFKNVRHQQVNKARFFATAILFRNIIYTQYT